MKPQQLDVEYCIENKEFVNGLLEKRGGWQEGDWYHWDTGYATGVQLVGRFECQALTENEDGYGIQGLIWLPTVGDVLGMLEATGIESVVVFKAPVSEGYMAGYSRPREPTYYGPTRLIALLELLKTVEGKR